MSDTPSEGTPRDDDRLSKANEDKERRYAAYLDYIPPKASFMAFVLTDAIQWHAKLRIALTELNILGQVCEWHAADVNERERARYDKSDPSYRGYGSNQGMLDELTRRNVVLLVVTPENARHELDRTQEAAK